MQASDETTNQNHWTWRQTNESCKLFSETGLKTVMHAEAQRLSEASRATWRKSPLRSCFAEASNLACSSCSSTLTWNAPRCPCWLTRLMRTLSNLVWARRQAWNKLSKAHRARTSQKINNSSRKQITSLALMLEKSQILESHGSSLTGCKTLADTIKTWTLQKTKMWKLNLCCSLDFGVLHLWRQLAQEQPHPLLLLLLHGALKRKHPKPLNRIKAKTTNNLSKQITIKL